MYDLLSIEEDSEAAKRGWSVEYVFDCKTRKLVVLILPRHFAPPWPHAPAATAGVIQAARDGDRLSIKALGLMTRGLKPKGKK